MAVVKGSTAAIAASAVEASDIIFVISRGIRKVRKSRRSDCLLKQKKEGTIAYCRLVTAFARELYSPSAVNVTQAQAETTLSA